MLFETKVHTKREKDGGAEKGGVEWSGVEWSGKCRC